MSYPPGPPSPYGQPQENAPYGYPQQGQSYGYPQQVGPAYGYGYPQPAAGPYGYPGQVPGGYRPPGDLIALPYLGTVQSASLGQRFLARVLDGFVTGIVILIAFIAGLAGSGLRHDGTAPSSHAITVFFSFVATMAIFALLYEWLMISFLGATLGKMAVGLKVVRLSDGLIPGLGRGFVRYIIPMVGFLLCYIGAAVVYLSPCFDNSGLRQGWHDRAAGTVVIKR